METKETETALKGEAIYEVISEVPVSRGSQVITEVFPQDVSECVKIKMYHK